MRRTICFLILAALILAIVAIPVFADATNWQIQMKCTTAKGWTNRGVVTIGVDPKALDGKDDFDTLGATLPGSTWIDLYELRTEWSMSGSNNYSTDFRAPFTSGSKIWNNIFVNVATTASDTATFQWTPVNLPAGSFTLVDVTNKNTAYDLTTAGSLTFTVSAGKVYKEFRIVATIGNGGYEPVYAGSTNDADAGNTDLGKIEKNTRGSVSFDANGAYAYVGNDDSRLLRYDMTKLVAKKLLTSAGNPSASDAIRSRIAVYGDKLYFTSKDGMLYGCDPLVTGTDIDDNPYIGESIFDPVQVSASSTMSSTPAVVTDAAGAVQAIYVATDTGMLVKYTVSGTTATKVAEINIGAPMSSSPVVLPSFDMVWIGTDNGKVVVVDSALTNIRATVTLGTKISSSPHIAPWTATAVVGVVGGSKGLAILNPTSLSSQSAAFTYGAGLNVESSPFIDFTTNNVYFTASDHQLHAVRLSDGQSVAGFPVQLYKPDESKFGVQPVMASPGVYNGKVYVGGGYFVFISDANFDFADHDCNFYVVDASNGTILNKVAANRMFSGSPSISPAAGKVAIANLDGHVYFFNL